MIRWRAAGAVRGRVLDARRRCQRGAVRLAQPRPHERRRRRPRRREPAPAVRRGRRRSSSGSRSTGRCTRPLVHRAEPGARGEPGDGLWTEEPDVPILALTADCLPIALARVGGDRPARRRAARRLARTARRDRRQGAAALGGRLHGGGRPRDRAVLLRGRARGVGAVRGAFGARRAARTEPRPLERRRARAPRRRASRTSSASTSARSAIPSSSSRIGAPGCHGAARE